MGRNCPIHGIAIYADCIDCDCKLCRNIKRKYSEVCIGIDQSYNNTGISIAADDRLVKVTSVWLDKCKDNSERREKLRRVLDKAIQSCINNSKNVTCILERIRLRSQGFVNIDYIKSIGALNSVIVDVCHNYLIPTYSVDTRCWKSQVIGTSRGAKNGYGVPEEKWPTVNWVCEMGFEESIMVDMTGTRKTKGIFYEDDRKYMYNDDAADSAGIAMFWFKGDHDRLKREM